MIKPDFFKNKRIFLTGHTGFKGAWLCEILLKLNAHITGYALAPNTDPNLFDILGLKDRIAHHHIGDLRDQALLEDALAKAKPDIIIHMAAQPIVSTGCLLYTSPSPRDA